MISRNSFGSIFPLVRLGDVVNFLDSKRRPVTESDRFTGIYPYFGANGQQGTINDYIFNEPLVLLAEDGGHFDDPDRGIAFLISGKTWVNNHAHVLQPKAVIDIAFLCRVLENYDLSPYIAGTTRSKLTQAKATEIIIPLPPLTDQRRIAEILDKAEALRAKRRTALAQLGNLAQTIFLEMFGDPTTNPRKWPTQPLLKVCDEIIDCPHSTPFWTEKGEICLRTSNLTEGGWNWIDTRFVSETTFKDRSKRCYLKPGDIVLSREGTVGIAAIVTANMRACMGQRLVQVRISQSVLRAEFLLRYLLYILSPERIGKVMVGSTSRHLNVKELRSLPIPLPPINLQNEFSKQLDTVDKLKNVHMESLRKIDELFKTLQNLAFNANKLGNCDND